VECDYFPLPSKLKIKNQISDEKTIKLDKNVFHVQQMDELRDAQLHNNILGCQLNIHVVSHAVIF
jgi:hypothetical protein